MSILKPIDHQNIVLCLLARSAACDAQHLTALAHAHKLPVSLHQVRVACDALVEQQFVARTIKGYQLTTHGEREVPAVPLLESYYTASSKHNDSGAIETRHESQCLCVKCLGGGGDL